MNKRQSLLLSLSFLTVGLGITYAPIPGLQQTLVVVSGTELQEPLEVLKHQFETKHPEINLQLEFQGSQDMINHYLDDRNDFDPGVLIPANGVILNELADRWQALHQESPFAADPQPVARTVLVATVWPERGQALFPAGRFDWDRIQLAMNSGDWADVGGESRWGSFDFVMTDPTRSNSGQLTLSLWASHTLDLQRPLNPVELNTPPIEALFQLINRSVYLPPRSTDILLQEFIAQGPNDADVAMVYESIALLRWAQSATTQGNPYHIYYLDPTVETVSTAARVKRNISSYEQEMAATFVDFLLQPEQQAVFVQHGFRPTQSGLDLQSVPNSPWGQGIPGAEIQLSSRILPLPNEDSIAEIKRLWERSQ